MTGVRKALIVATDQYSDPKLTRLNAPAEDARALAEVLRDPDVGAYEVETVLNKTCQEVEIAVASFFQSGARDDTLLVHFSCHGVKDLSGELYFAATDTKLPLLRVTGVSSSMVKNAMEDSRASLILCLVDCCYSGAFTKSTKAAATVDLTERLGGRGRAVITASTSLQLALDGQEEPSLFTHAVVEGLRSGEADRDLDGLVTLDEFYNYIHEKVTEKNPDQTPVKSFDVQGEVYVARRGGPITTPAPLPRELSDTLATGEDWQRLGAVSRLTDLLNAGHPGRALAARLELERVQENDDSNKVRNAAAAALEAAGAHVDTMPEIPDYTEAVGTRSATITGDDTSKRTGAGGSPTQPGRDDDGGRGFRRWGIPVGAALAVLVLVVAGWAVANYTGDDPDDGNTTNQAPVDVTILAPSELLVGFKDGDGVRHLYALNVDTGDKREIVVYRLALPTVSQDRKSMFYLVDGDGEPRRVQVDGLHRDRALLNVEMRGQCPRTNRPSQSLDKNYVALVCKDESGTVLGVAFGPIDGTDLKPLYESSAVKEGPTWDDQENVYFVLEADGDTEPTVLMRVATSGGEPERVADGVAGWLTHPDWSESGLLFLRSAEGNGKGDVYRLESDGSATRMTTVQNAESPTWSPDGTRFVYLTTENGVKSLHVQDNDPNAKARKLDLTGDLGPPAWGSR